LAEKKAIPLRISYKMWEELSRWADEEFRSVNGQIEYILNEAINKRKKNSPQDNIKDEDIDEEKDR
jgi:hypothetical protein